ncbi:hypothetical protein EG329_008888 [Mollisiaceae sp. DMI_Dod_QoI]|nr:hypothetical protein EG329_008888 [Helotiales sp. DMI_Dod_QoI]
MRAKAMHEKLWTKCSEFYLLALAYNHLQNKPSNATVDGRFTRESLLATLDLNEKFGLTSPEFSKACTNDLNEVDEFRYSGLVEASDIGNERPFGYPRGDPIFYAIPPVLKTFFSMRRAYTQRRKELGPQKCDYSRWKEVVVLGLCRRDDMPDDRPIIEEMIWKAYKDGPLDVDNSASTFPNTSKYLLLTTNVRAFCIQAGCPFPDSDPLANVGRLREHISTKEVFNTMPLHKMIMELRAQVIAQQKVIAALSFRHMLENVCPGKGSYTERWQRFWTVIWANAKKEAGKGRETPMTILYKQYDKHSKGLEDVDTAARNLYGMLSDNIHKPAAWILPGWDHT